MAQRPKPDKILVDVTFSVSPGVVAIAPREFCITFMFSKTEHLCWYFKSRMTTWEFVQSLMDFVQLAVKTLILE